MHFFSEKYNPPANVSVTYNVSYYIIRWDNPKIRFHLSHHILCYEVDVQRKVQAPSVLPSALPLGAEASRMRS